ncbi:MAG: hypothetical protein U5L05_06685 [Rubrivivax sp.]|nr:hypothetical protein [Rubrivivax sp.]
MPQTPEGDEALQFEPVEVPGRHDLAREVVELLVFDPVVFGIGVAQRRQQRGLVVQVLADQGLERFEVRIEALLVRRTAAFKAVPGEPLAQVQQADPRLILASIPSRRYARLLESS